MTPDLPPSRSAARPADLSEAEFAELDELLAATPEPLEPLDVVLLDGYLCGIIVQPILLEPDAWLPRVFDEDGRSLPEGIDADWRARTTALIVKRHAALQRAIVEDGWFEPLLYDPDDTDEAADDPDTDDLDAELSPIQRTLLPWVAGFAHALDAFPALAEVDDDAVALALARVLRHLPPDTDEQREVFASFDRELPLADVDAAVDELVEAVAELQDLTRDARFRVDTVRRDAPKVGRNDPCPCGSGKKFKHCHGKG